MRVMLATSLAADGERDEALEHATAAVQLLERGDGSASWRSPGALAADLR